ncbi:DUF1499 domain-containing protein [Trichothermofontia sichuanensis B231]|uniref:DUF1499 domain-containing protein n=1 Tax=Trichothermofontia sichuanensis TaxID=3045816 RepID=UPI0022484AD6|nr:DUF1499 domain-containing protein [Trichothermofontia sichuanensis]UZQ54242.1 DUF1499 domain-containing protein [Trichothermofontia sichuanensis B231]
MAIILVGMVCWQNWVLVPFPSQPVSDRWPAQPIVEAMTTRAIVGSILSFPGTPPTNLGVKAGKLAPCPRSPNCVSSQSQDPSHHIEPLTYTGDGKMAFSQLQQLVAQQQRTRIVDATDTYLYAEFATPIIGFVDDVEFWLDEANGLIQVRSASRLGQSDLGVNRKRIETIRQQWQQRQA